VRFGFLHALQNGLGDIGKFHLRGVEHRVLVPEAREPGGELKYLNPIEVPAVRFGHRPQLALSLGERYVEPFLALARALHEKLHGKSSFSSAGIAFYEVYVVARETSGENVVQSGDTGRDPSRIVVVHHLRRSSNDSYSHLCSGEIKSGARPGMFYTHIC
jgi:hypothetical protein